MSVAFNATFTESTEHTATFSETPNPVSAEFEAQVQIGDVLPFDETPLMDGEASAGTAPRFSRGDHRHPHDSEKMDYMSAISNLELEAMLQ